MKQVPVHTPDTFSQIRHALRTPLNHIIGYAEMLAEDAADIDDHESAAALKRVRAEAQRICDLIQTLNVQGQANIENELSSVRRQMLPHIACIRSSLAFTEGLNQTDLERIDTAAAELLAFAERGDVPALASADAFPRSLHVKEEGPRRSARLLVVDDDEGNRDVLRRHLERQGHTVEEAHGGFEALRLLHSETFEAVLLDLLMPGMNGLDVLDRLKQDPELRDVPVLVISASDDLGGVAESIQRGAEDYLLKPFDPVLLHARLSATLDRKNLRDSERLKSVELERLTSELQRSNEDLQRFAYAASHDLQAPVRTITTYIQLLQRRMKTRISDDEREMFAFAEGAAKRMHALIRDLLQYSQATTQETRLEPIATEELFDALVLDMEASIEDAEAQVLRDHLPVIVSDPTLLRQLLQNLISNAIKYRRQDELPRVHVSAATANDHWRFTVRDNGEGIAPEHLARIFEMFQRLHGDDVPGSGIGLAVCKRIVERSGGKIWVDSEVGRGSMFCFTVPFPSHAAL